MVNEWSALSEDITESSLLGKTLHCLQQLLSCQCMKLAVHWKWFGTGSIDGLGMFSGTTIHDYVEGKMLGKATRVRKGLSYCMIQWNGEIMDSQKV